MERLRDKVEQGQRTLGIEEAQAVAGYTRALLAVAKDRKPLRDQGKSLDELLEEAKRIPALREAFRDD